MRAQQAAAAVAAARWFNARSGQGARPCSAYGQNPLEEMGHAGINDSCILRPLFGIGIANGRARWTTRTILLAWQSTLPTAPFISGSVYLLIPQL
jgi:hypothetical protein